MVIVKSNNNLGRGAVPTAFLRNPASALVPSEGPLRGRDPLGTWGARGRGFPEGPKDSGGSLFNKSRSPAEAKAGRPDETESTV